MSDIRPTTKAEQAAYHDALSWCQKLKNEGKRILPFSLVKDEPFNIFSMVVKAAKVYNMAIEADPDFSEGGEQIGNEAS